MTKRKTTGVQCTVDAVSTRSGPYTMDDIIKDVLEVLPKLSIKSIRAAMTRLLAYGMVRGVGKKRIVNKKGMSYHVALYETVPGADFSKFHEFPAKVTRSVQPIEKTTEPKEKLTSHEVGEAVIMFIESLKQKIQELADAHSEKDKKLEKMGREKDMDHAEELRRVKLEFNQTINVKTKTIEQLNKKISELNEAQRVATGKTLQLSEVVRFGKL